MLMATDAVQQRWGCGECGGDGGSLDAVRRDGVTYGWSTDGVAVKDAVLEGRPGRENPSILTT